jgi:3-oxoacyl-[acyl-carrier protein] reductase
MARAFTREGAPGVPGRPHPGQPGEGRPVDRAVRTTFLTSRAAGRHMVRQGSGVILAFGGSGDPPRDDYLGGLQVAFETIEGIEQSMLGRGATLEDVGNVAAFVASDRARTMTAATANISCGALIDR